MFMRDFQSVGLPVVFGHKLELRIGRDAKDAAIGDVNHVEVAGSIEAGTFQE